MNNTFNFEILLPKYAGGRTPPLIDVANPPSGLINGELLQIYHSGVLSKHSILFRILLPAKRYTSLEEKWTKGEFVLTECLKSSWPAFCNFLRDKTSDELCDACGKHWAAIAEDKQGVIAYLCHAGMIDFVAPICFKGQIAALIFCGQFKPQAGPIWNPELLEHDGYFRMLESGAKGVDVLEESRRRMQQIERKAGLAEGTLFGYLADVDRPAVEISPEQVEVIRKALRKTADQLSSLAMSTYELERSKVVDQIRSLITSSLALLGTSEDSPAVWRKLSDGLAYVTKYFALDYCLIVSYDDRNGSEIGILCHSGLPEDKFPMGKRLSVKTSWLSSGDLMFKLQEPASLMLRDFKALPVFDQLHQLHKKTGQRVAAIPYATPGSARLIILLGRFKQDTDLGFLQTLDREALDRIVEEIALVIRVVLLIEELEATADKQRIFLEDVAHDIKTPIQNMIFEAEVLTRGLASGEGAERRARRITSQARRLDLLSQRAWTLMNFERGAFKQTKTEPVDIYQIIMGYRKSLLDLAERRNIQVSVDRELEHWLPVRMNKDLFSQAILNLMDNAIKYSRDGTEVRVDGKRVASDIVSGKPVPGGVTLSFVNRGIPIRDEDKDKIFDRYYRTAEAQDLVQTGTGIGLAIVDAFVKHHNASIEISSMPITGTQDYVTEFKIFIPSGGIHHA